MGMNLGSFLWPDVDQVRQPQQNFGLDLTNPIAASSTVVMVPSAGMVNLIDRKAFSNAALNPVVRTGTIDKVYSGTTLYIFNVPVSVTTYPFAIYFVQVKDGGGNWVGLSNTFNRFDLAFLRGDLNSTTTVTYSTDNDLIASPATPNGRHCMMLVARSATDRALFIDGVKVASATSSKTAAFNKFNIGGVEREGGEWLGGTVTPVSLAGLSQGLMISDAQACIFTSDPWDIFTPTALMWAPPVAGGTATVIPIGVSATGSVGTPAATGAALATPAGVSAAASVGAPTATGGTSIPATVTPPGVSATASVGTPSATGAAKATPAGVSASAAVGTPAAFGGTSIPATVLPAGVAALSYVGTPIATGAAKALPAGVQTASAVGAPVASVGASGAATVQPSGVQALIYIGTVIATGAARAYPAGASAVGAIGFPIAYAGVFEAYIPGAMAGSRMVVDSIRSARVADSTRHTRVQTGSRPAR